MKKINFLLIAVIACIGIVLVQNSVAQTAQVDTFNRTITLHDSAWTLSYYVPPSYNPANKYKLIIALPGLGMTSTAMRNFFLYDIIDTDSTGLVNNPASPVYNNAIVVVPNYYYTEIDYDTALITSCLSDAVSAYNIDPHYIYLSGFSYGGRAALHYGLLNYWRFRGLELYTPAFQSLAEAQNLTHYQYMWQNGKYIPIYISVGGSDSYSTRVPAGYQNLCDAGAIATLQIIYGLPHDPGPNPNTFYGYDYVDSHATTYAMNDAGISAISAPFGDICSASFTPVVTIQNKGIGTLTSAIINYQIDNGTVNTYSWSGSLIQLGVDSVRLPLQTISSGAHTFQAYTTMPNGVADTVPSNDTMTESFNCMTNGTDILTEGFEGTLFPPSGWQLAGTDDAWAWQRLSTGDTSEFSYYTLNYPTAKWGAYGQSASCIYFNNYIPDYVYYVQYSTGERHSIRTPQCDFTNSNNPTLTYDYAYAPYSSMFSDTLAVYYSVDCGNTWDTLLVKGGLALSTIGNYDSSDVFIPTSAQWENQTISLNNPAIIGQPEVMFSFEVRSGQGNMLYLDNISINAITGIANETQEHDSISIYPNPTSDKAIVTYTLKTGASVIINIYDITGKLIRSYNEGNVSAGLNQQIINTQDLPNAVYLLSIETNGSISVSKLVVYR